MATYEVRLRDEATVGAGHARLSGQKTAAPEGAKTKGRVPCIARGRVRQGLVGWWVGWAFVATTSQSREAKLCST